MMSWPKTRNSARGEMFAASVAEVALFCASGSLMAGLPYESRPGSSIDGVMNSPRIPARVPPHSGERRADAAQMAGRFPDAWSQRVAVVLAPAQTQAAPVARRSPTGVVGLYLLGHARCGLVGAARRGPPRRLACASILLPRTPVSDRQASAVTPARSILCAARHTASCRALRWMRPAPINAGRTGH